MTNQITRDELLDLIFVEKGVAGNWFISGVKSDIYGKVQGDVYGDISGGVFGNIEYSVIGDVIGDVGGNVGGTIDGREWNFVETPKEKLQRLVKEGATKEALLAAIDQLEGS
jgi:hypothetical protein